MPHPFFGVGRYPWPLAEAQALHKSLYQSVKAAKDIELIYQECSMDLPPLQAQAALPMWKDVLEAVAGAELLPVLGERLQARPELGAVHKAYFAAANLPDPVLSPVLSDERIFIDRDTLRTEVSRIGRTKTSTGVLLVRGAPKSGKSWTRHIVVEHAKAMGEKPIVMAQGVVASVRDVLNRIFAVLNGKLPKGLTTDPAWYGTVCSEMIRFAEKGKYARYWIIVDDLGGMDGNIRAFLEQAALNMIDDSFATRFRLVLIDYPDGPLPVNWKKEYSVEQRTAEADVHAGALAEFLNRWATHKKKLLTEEKAKELAAGVLTAAEAPAPAGDARPRLERIHDELSAVLGKL